VLDALHSPFNQSFLQRKMDKMLWIQKPAGMRIPRSAGFSRCWTLAVNPDQTSLKHGLAWQRSLVFLMPFPIITLKNTVQTIANAL
jgi:hypothetical protein